MSKPRVVRKSSQRNVRRESVFASLPNRPVVLFLAIFALALVLRLIYLLEIESIPLFYHLPGDPRTYDEWARRIAAGDWLGKGVFYQAPLYPYFLGLLQFFLGHDLWAVRIVQVVLVALSCSFLYLAGSWFFSRPVGVSAALVLAFYAPAIFYSGLIEKSVPDLFLMSLWLLCLAGAGVKPHWAKWLTAGMLLGLLGLSRENALLLAVVVAPWIGLHFVQHERSKRLQWIAVFAAGLLVVLIPVGLRNLIVGGEFTLTTSQLGPNFFIGNNPEADGTYSSVRLVHGERQLEGKDAARIAEQALGRPLSPGEVSRYWLDRSLDYIRSQPLDWLRLLGKKWLLFWNVREIEDSDDYYIYQSYSRVLRLLGWSNFGLVAPLAVVGMVLMWRQRRRIWLLYGLLLTFAFSVSLFYVFGRYRFPIAPVVALFAGAALVEITAFVRGRDRRGLAIAGGIFLASALIVNWPVLGPPGPSAGGYNNLGNAQLKQGKSLEAIESFKKALALDPGHGLAHFNLGNLYASTGKLDEAVRHFQEAVRILPNFAEAHSNLGKVLAQRGEIQNAIDHFRQALRSNSMLSGPHVNLGIAFVGLNRIAEAQNEFQQALRLEPNSAEANYLLGSLLASRGELDKAIEHFRRAIRSEPEFAEAHKKLAQALAIRGEKEEAVRHYQEALRIYRSATTR
ncbi:MAG: tetratricopeptide repeat protein [Deltaproteobacteria bacterium]|nr:tetratricopeptide repeat protein [Deltaproteobacteria bacterium]